MCFKTYGCCHPCHILYRASQDCSLEVVGGQLNTAFFGVAMKAEHFMNIIDDIILGIVYTFLLFFSLFNKNEKYFLTENVLMLLSY